MDDRPVFDAKTALVVVDVQNDFAHPEGNLFVPGGDLVVPKINALIEQAKKTSAFVVYTQDWHPERTPHFEEYRGKWPVHCVQGTWGARLVDGLRVEGPVLRKGIGGEDGYSGFTVHDPETGRETRTELDEMLKERGIEKVVVVGLAEDVCVKETALDAVRLGYETCVVGRATRPVSPDETETVRAQMRSEDVVLV